MIEVKDIQSVCEALYEAKRNCERLEMVSSKALDAWWPVKRACKASGMAPDGTPEYKAWEQASSEAHTAHKRVEYLQRLQQGLQHVRAEQVADAMVQAIRSSEALGKYDGQPLRYKKVQGAIAKALGDLATAEGCSWYVDERYGCINVTCGSYGTCKYISDHHCGEECLDLEALDVKPSPVDSMTLEDVEALVSQYEGDVETLQEAYKAVGDTYHELSHKYSHLGLEMPRR